MDFIGRGFSYPMALDPTGHMVLVGGVTDVEQAIEIILRTAPGERPMRPEFGCDAQALVFAPADATTAGRLAHDVRRALERWEPRVEVVDVRAGPDPTTRDRLYVEIEYTLRSTYDVRSLVYPFYVLPKEDER